MTDQNAPVSFAQAFAPVQSFVDAPVHGTLAGKRRKITVFDWSELDDDLRGMLIECQRYCFAKAAGDGWAERLVPFALVGGESHPVPLDELDQQADGVLLLDLEAGGAVVLCDDPSNEKAKRVAASAAELAVGR